MRRIIVIVQMFLIATVFASCRKESGDKQITIAVIPKGTTHNFWQTVQAGALKAEQEFGVDLPLYP